MKSAFVAMTLTAALVTAATGLLVESTGGSHAARAHEKKADDQARARMLALGWRPPSTAVTIHGVELLHAREGFELALGHGVVSGEAARSDRLAVVSRLIAEELSRHAPEVLRAAELRRVVLCGRLREDRRPIPSLPNYNNTLLLDVDGADDYLRRLLHHELFHFLDLADDGSVLRDPAWEALNAPGFSYAHGGRAMRGPEARVTPPPPGFVSGYATAAVEEDKAETFAEWMWARDALRERAADDPVLRAKVDAIQKYLP